MKPGTPSKNCLHLVARSSARALECCRAQFDQGDAVLFLDDGVMHIASGLPDAFSPPFAVCSFSAVDLDARGLTALALDADARVLSDPEIIECLNHFDACLTWK